MSAITSFLTNVGVWINSIFNSLAGLIRVIVQTFSFSADLATILPSSLYGICMACLAIIAAKLLVGR